TRDARAWSWPRPNAGWRPIWITTRTEAGVRDSGVGSRESGVGDAPLLPPPLKNGGLRRTSSAHEAQAGARTTPLLATQRSLAGKKLHSRHDSLDLEGRR